MKYALILVLLVLWSCSSLKHGVPAGEFHGYLPCADCPGITTTLTLNPDQTYVLSQRNVDRDIEPTVTEGTYQLRRTRGQVVLSGEIAGMRHLRVDGESLVLVDEEGQPVDSDVPERYVLQRDKPEEVIFSNDQAVFFRATGNEPFWMVEMDPEGGIQFKALGPTELDMSFTLVGQDPSEAGVSYTFTGESEQGRIVITTVCTPCTDDMSGEQRTHTVSVSLQLAGQEAPLAYQGCGLHPHPYGIHDIWRLTTLQGEAIDAESEGLFPYLIINALNGTATGSGGCNRVNGTFLLRGETITFGEFISTKRACPILDLESRFMAAMSGQTFTIQVGDQLTLSKKDMTLEFTPHR